MNHDDEDLRMLAEGIQRALSLETPAEADAALEELGWLDAWTDWGDETLHPVFTVQGELRADSGLLDSLIATTLGAPAGSAVILPRSGSVEPPGCLDAATLSIEGAATPLLRSATHAAVVHRDGATARAVLVEAPTLASVATQGLETDGYGAVSARDVRPTADLGEVDWDRVVELGRLALACELVGLGRGMIAAAREHALAREQFGRPIAGFQAVRHRLAEALVAVEAADAAVRQTLAAAQTDPAATRTHAAMSKALSGQGARTAARHCQQVLAGIGFTVEHPFHQFLRRTLVLDALFGSARALTRELGETAVRERGTLFDLPL